MSVSTPTDISVQIVVPSNTRPNDPPLVSAERRITPSWTVAELKRKLEPVTGIPASSQSLRIRSLDGTWLFLDDEASLVGDVRYNLHRGSEIEVIDGRPTHLRQTFNFSDLTSVEKYQMPEAQYEKLEDSVLAWKRRQKLGRFDPNAKSAEDKAEDRFRKDQAEIEAKGVQVGLRCRVGNDDGRRGVVRFTGEIPGLGGAKEAGCIWVGIELDEPVGRNDGSATVETEEGGQAVKRMFECREKFGVFARPEKVQVGEFPPLNDFRDEEMEEI
ncbi:uncharacterized protein Z518_11188 [Rhinocladiella mackenziei CBS 650.93]|uniref:CAP-Gly domain-containing protein n=1 Tax=Rhinocladiella mackenziei CBS 650.93 TaxID=1442369 RepID=A0A0D2IRU8_9EURO|nr:uncharacterized protein Z518_11188 [Rhinocladiella mackenziei CBS 650.93]KIW99449.1 hypothetical protein Z518_11188 [Rhinocladiella mackenziei CBS 650.93]